MCAYFGHAILIRWNISEARRIPWQKYPFWPFVIHSCRQSLCSWRKKNAKTIIEGTCPFFFSRKPGASKIEHAQQSRRVSWSTWSKNTCWSYLNISPRSSSEVIKNASRTVNYRRVCKNKPRNTPLSLSAKRTSNSTCCFIETQSVRDRWDDESFAFVLINRWENETTMFRNLLIQWKLRIVTFSIMASGSAGSESARYCSRSLLQESYWTQDRQRLFIKWSL